MEFNQENFDKLLETTTKATEELENYKKAVKEERERRKQEATEKTELQTQLEELQSFKKELEEKDAKKKGKYEELLTEKEAQIKELTDKIGGIEAKAIKFDEFLTKTLEEKLSKIPEEKQEFIKKVLDGKSHDDQVSLLDWFIEDYSVKDFKAKPNKEWNDPDNKTEYEKAKSEWNISGMITNAPVIE